MTKDESDLLKAFDKAYDYFNNHEFTRDSWAEIMDPLLDEDVRMKRIDDPGQYHEGRDNVRDYFVNGHGLADQATFKSTSRVCQVVGKLGFISGFADFVDKNGTKHPHSRSRRIAYSFSYHKESGSWKAIHLWGAYV